MLSKTKNKALFLDRDGVIIRKASEGNYIKSVSEVEILVGAAEAIKLARDLGYLVIIITNQRGIALRKMTKNDVSAIHAYINSHLKGSGTQIDAFYVCPHDRGLCECRKPKPGLIFQATKDYNIDLSKSHLIGDRSSDIQAGRAAGIVTARLYLSETDSSILSLVHRILGG